MTLGIAIGGGDFALADVEYDQYITPDIIFGTGNTNGSFTTDRQNGVEVGIRAKIPYVGTLHSNGDGTYSYSLAETDHDNNAGSPNIWNFDWTINTDYDDTSGLVLSDLTYELGLDQDPGLGVDFATFDPVTPSVAAPFYDHSIGDNATPNGGGTEAGDAGEYLTLLDGYNVLQQSWRYAWMPVTFDPTIPGTYDIYLLARDGGGTVVAKSEIQVLIGGAPPTGPKIACEGFENPMDADVAVQKPNRVLPLKMALLDDAGPLTDVDIVANPVVQVVYDGTFEGSADLASLETSGKGDDGNMFVFDIDKWAFNMKTKELSSGAYTISVVSGDLAEYVIDPSCEVGMTIR